MNTSIMLFEFDEHRSGSFDHEINALAVINGLEDEIEAVPLTSKAYALKSEMVISDIEDHIRKHMGSEYDGKPYPGDRAIILKVSNGFQCEIAQVNALADSMDWLRKNICGGSVDF